MYSKKKETGTTQMEILDLFPTQIFAKKCRLDLDSISNECRNFQLENYSVAGSSIGGNQFKNFRSLDLDKEIASSLPRSNNKELKSLSIFQWLNINKENSYNVSHSHGPFVGNALSGVFYVNAPENCGDITFYDPRGVITSAIDLDYYSDSPRYNTIKPYNNLLLIFPSWLEHSVNANLSTQERISIGFNIQIEYTDKLDTDNENN